MVLRNGAYTWDMCWRYDCLPDNFYNKTFSITAARVPVPSGGSALAGSTVIASYMGPSCAPLSSYIVPASTAIRTISLDSNQVVVVPGTAISGVTFQADVRANCDDQYIAGILAVVYASAPQPLIPKSSCPCWDRPGEGGSCGDVQVPITLTTTQLVNGISYRQCVDPANYDIYTGRMAFSFCWRYKCLPDAFASSEFTATVADLDRYNIKRMPGGLLYNATIQRTPGVAVDFTGKAKATTEAALTVSTRPSGGLRTLPNGDWMSANVTAPASGVNNITVQYTVPVGFDDLSAAVVLDLWPGQPLPANPPAPPGTVCRCPAVPVNGVCGEATILSEVSLASDPSTKTYQCLYLPQYDVFTRYFAFSTCWRWACLPAAFNGKAYNIAIRNITQYNIDAMPGGESRVQWLKPTTVNMSIVAHPKSAPDLALGPWTSTAATAYGDVTTVTLPSEGMYSFDITIAVPLWPWIDGNSGAFVIRSGPAPPSPPSPPPRPPLPPATAVSSNQTVVVAEFYVLKYLMNDSDVESLLDRATADIQARVSGYLVTFPLSFPDYRSVADCSVASQQAFITQMAAQLGLDPTSLSTTCRYGGTTSARRRLLQTSASACSEAAVSLSLSLAANLTTVNKTAGVSNLVSAANGALSGAGACVSEPTTSTQLTVFQAVTSSSAASSACSGLYDTVPAALRATTSNTACTVSTRSAVDAATGVATPVSSSPSPPPSPPGTASSGDSGSSGINSGVTGGAIGGAVGGVVLLVGAALIVMHVKRKREQPPAATSGPAAPGYIPGQAPRHEEVVPSGVSVSADSTWVQPPRPATAVPDAGAPAYRPSTAAVPKKSSLKSAAAKAADPELPPAAQPGVASTSITAPAGMPSGLASPHTPADAPKLPMWDVPKEEVSPSGSAAGSRRSTATAGDMAYEATVPVPALAGPLAALRESGGKLSAGNSRSVSRSNSRGPTPNRVAPSDSGARPSSSGRPSSAGPDRVHVNLAFEAAASPLADPARTSGGGWAGSPAGLQAESAAPRPSLGGAGSPTSLPPLAPGSRSQVPSLPPILKKPTSPTAQSQPMPTSPTAQQQQLAGEDENIEAVLKRMMNRN